MKKAYFFLYLCIFIITSAFLFFGVGLPGSASRGDIAERMPLSMHASDGPLHPSRAEVVVVDEDGFIQKCMNRESPFVVGIVSTKPAHTLRNMIKGSVPVALSGVVPCKVTDENGTIEPGDLLVAATKPGYAMKAPRKLYPGTVVGKALDPQENKEDIITVLVLIR